MIAIAAPPARYEIGQSRNTQQQGKAPNEAARNWPLILFAIDGLLNIAWSPIFFKLRRSDWAFVELLPFWVSILALLLHIGSVSTLAGALMAPYLAWVTFAGYLNRTIVQINKPFVTHPLFVKAP